jgi:hypothetical protein
LGFLHLLILTNFTGIEVAIIFFVFSMLVAFLTGVSLGYLEDRGWIEQSISKEEIGELEAEEKELVKKR